jgi:hypothetical protein
MECMEAILKSGFSAMVAYSIHYGTTKFYNIVCVPDTMLGYLSGLITSGSPMCQATLQVISNTQVSYSTLIMSSITRLFIDVVSR